MTQRAPMPPSVGNEPAFVLPEVQGKSARLVSLAILVSTTTILVVANLESFGFAASGLTGLLHLSALGLGLLLLVVGAIRANARQRDVGAAMLLGAIVAIVAVFLIHRSQQARSTASGDAVCAALDAWHEQHGRYPDALQELVPAFLPNVPTSAMGLWSTIPFRYQRDATGDDYSLAFDSPAWIVCERGRRRPWRCDD